MDDAFRHARVRSGRSAALKPIAWRAAFLLAVLVAVLPARSSEAAQWTSPAYLGRYFMWGPVFLVRQIRGINPVYDEYERFAVRTIRNPAQAFIFPASAAFSVPAAVEYREGDRTERVDLESFLTSTGTNSFIVLKDGTLVYERYLNGRSRDSLCVSQSVAKSFTSALIGMALSEGHLKSLDDPVTQYLPELDAGVYGAVTVRQLLAMTSGLAFNMGYFPWNDAPLYVYSPDLRALMTEASLAEPPGTSFHYNNYNTVVLGMILERVTRRRPSDLLEEKIWMPLGMEYPASWTLDGDVDSFEQMAQGLNVRAIDYAKLGQLYLDGGSWNGAQLVPRSWIEESTSRDSSDERPWRTYGEWKDAGGYYKYGWWGVRRGTQDAFTALGDYGQFIFVDPKTRVVIVRTGDRWGIPFFVWPQALSYLADSLQATEE